MINIQRESTSALQFSSLKNASIPWTDRPGALEELSRRINLGLIKPEYEQFICNWIEQGYFVVDLALDKQLFVDWAMDVWRVYENRREDLGLNIDLISSKLEGQTKSANELSKRWRVHNLQHHSRAAKQLFEDACSCELANTVLGVSSSPIASISFYYGSEQELHQDMDVFHVFPPNFLIGVWIACEDISEDSGPLVICPGSHRANLFPPFLKNYPYENARTASPAELLAYRDFILAQSEEYEKKSILLKQGQAVFWHGRLIHGGSPIRGAETTRKSFVIHYMPTWANKIDSVTAPTNW